MRKICYVLVLLFLPLVVNAEVKVEVSETVELMSVLSRLAGYDEYCQETNSYASDIDKWFANYKNHSTVSYFKQLRQNNGIAYDRVADMGIHLAIENGTLNFVFDRSLLDSRWKDVDLNSFLNKLKSFYSDTKFHDFYVAHEDSYSKAVNAYKNGVLPYFHQEWYSSFYGTETNDNYWVIISLNNGDNNYGVKRQTTDGKRDVINVCNYRIGGNDKNYAMTLIHEFNHSYVNPLLEDNSYNTELIQDAGQWLYKFSQWIMNNSAYGSWSTVINESLVRACVVIYMLDNGYSSKEIESQIMSEISSGFTWTPELVTKLKDYTDNRDKYKTLSDFYPEIAKCLDEYVSGRRSISEKNLSSKENFVKSNSSQVIVEASETVELMSVLSRLAGYEEYCLEDNSYTADIDKWFANYKNHATVSYHQKLRNKGISYHEPASFGIHLIIENGNLRLVSDISLLSEDWKNVDIAEYLKEVNTFYSETKFHDFYVAHKDYFAKAVNSYKTNVLPYFHQEWYTSFYGMEPKENYWVIISFNNGGHNYGVNRLASDGKRDVVNVCTYRENQNLDYAETLIHEFNHSFVNPLLDDSRINSDLIQDAGQWLYKFSQKVMDNSAYGSWSSVINESIVRAGVIMYLKEQGFPLSQIKDHMYYEISVGFTWTPELVDALCYYSTHREKYKTLNDFYPEIAKCLDNYVAKERAKISEFASMPEGNSFNVEKDGVSFLFESNRDTPMTLKLVSAKLKNKNYTTISIPASVYGHQVTIIGESAFYWEEVDPSTPLTVNIPEGVQEIHDDAFKSNKSIHHVTLPSTLKTIGAMAFSLTSLEELLIPASVVSLGYRFINHINALMTIVVDEKNPIFDSRDNCNAVIETASNTLIHGCKTSTVPKGVTAIGNYAFMECQAMSSFIIPSWVTSIGERTFWYCRGLNKIYSQMENPITIAKDLFRDLPSDAILYVPTGTKKKYEAAQGWNVIKNIVEMDMTDIKDVLTSTNEQKSLFYNLQGQRVKNPGKGIYIHNGRKVLIK